jgi:hypothetical protein
MRSARINLFVSMFAVAAVLAAGTDCFAQYRVANGGRTRTYELRYTPAYPQPWVQPPVRLGFYGHFDARFGMVVDYVTAGSIAQRVGLESGDAIVEINGRWINSDYAYYSALQASGGQGTMLVRDVRSGYQVYVPLTPFGGGIAYRSGY